MTPLASVRQINTLMARVKEDLHQISCPALLFVSDEDHVVPPENAEVITNQISSKEKSTIRLTDSYHVATLDHDQQKIIDHSLAFFKKHLEA
jgi:carboxylesterase